MNELQTQTQTNTNEDRDLRYLINNNDFLQIDPPEQTDALFFVILIKLNKNFL